MIETLGTLYRQAGHDFPPVPHIEQRGESISNATPGSMTYEALTFGTPTYTGRSVNPNTAMQYSAVWACIKILSEAVSSVSLLTYRNVSPDGLVRDLAVNDYRYRMLREQPNEEMSSMQWREFGMAALLGWGNWYNYLDLDGRGRIKMIYPLRPDWVIPLRNTRTGRMEYRYTPLYPLAAPVPPGVYDPEQILHIPGLGWDGIVGYSPIGMLRNAIALGMSQEEYSARLVGNNNRPNVALVSAAAIKDPEALRASWKKAYGGVQNTGEVAVLHGGLDLKTFTINPVDAQFLEGRSFQLSEIARIFNVPLGMLHDTLSKPETYASAEQADIRFVKHSVRPWCVRIEQKMNLSVLASNDALTCEHDLTDLYRGDLASQMNAYKSGVSGGLVTPNEGRVRLKFPPHTDKKANELYMQAQMVQLGTPPPAAPQKKPALPQAA